MTADTTEGDRVGGELQTWGFTCVLTYSFEMWTSKEAF